MEALRERFGKYHVLEKIAQGGMAEVYKVKTVGIAGFEKVQALKRILPNSAREGRFIRSFIDEARIAVELTHRNIVQVFDFGKADGELFLAMELIEGKDLRTAMGQAVARDMGCPIAIAAYIIAEVAAGLDYAHRKTDGYGGPLGIVHCDVSPSNVMLSADGYVKILDFGIARASFASALERRRLRGKPRYMAPEQTLGEPPTAAADVFALGIIAWEMFTGLPLYRGPNLKAILEAVRHTVPPRIDRVNPRVPTEIVDAVEKALQREPNRRGTSADLMAACTRTAMLAGSRTLATWLVDVEAHAPGAKPWQPGDSLDDAGPDPAAAPPSRPSQTASLGGVPVPPDRPSRTASLADMPIAKSLGEGTPFPHDAWADPPVPVRQMTVELRQSVIEMPPPIRPPTEPPLPEGAAFMDESGPVARYEPPPMRPPTEPPVAGETRPIARSEAPSLEPPRRMFELDTDEPATARAPEPIFEGATTARNAQRYVDREPHTIITSARPGTEVATEPVYRPSMTELMARPPVALDDNALPDETSFDELQIESAQMAAVSPDEPIDDDLGSMQTAAIADRRRTVVVFGLVEGKSRDAMRPITRSLGELAYARGGVVLALDDDGLLVAFGLEIAGEDDVAIAMGWALDASSLARETGGVALKIGARTGVATTAASDGVTRVPQDASDEARALAKEAAPDRPLFVGGAGRVTSNLYALREVPAPRSRADVGSRPRIPRRSRVIEVVGPRGFDERDRARLERKGKLVGRVHQLAELDAWLARAHAVNRRLVVLVSGAAGSGKSRLVAEMIARHPELQVTSTAASPATRLAPFSLVIDLYQAALALPPARGRGARAQLVHRLIHLMTKAGATLERAKIIAVDLDRAMELRDGVAVGAPEVADLRPRISAGLAAFRETMLGGPALTIIEDIHHGDSASLEVMRHTLAVPAHGPEMLLLTSRGDGPPPPAVDAIVTVGDLVGGELRALIADRLGDAATPYNIAAVIARGGGNPLFVEELAQAVREAGAAGEEVPASARDVVIARIDRLSPRARTTLRFASVFGGTVRARLLEELLGEESLAAELDELVEAGVLVRSESAAGSSEGELAFGRGLVREVVYDSLSARQQRDSHAQIGRLLASRFFAGREEPPAVIAEHLERGGEPAGAAAFWLRAGRLALAGSDADAAINYFSHALDQDRVLGPDPVGQTSRTRRREALAGREEARRLQGDLAADPHDLDDLEVLCEGSPARLADVSIRRAMRLLRLGDYANASIATIVAEDRATAAKDDRLRGEAMRVRGEILERLGQFDEALDTVAVARELFARQGAVTEEMQAMVGRGRIHLLRAHYETALEAYRPVLARIAKTGDPWLERVVKNHVAVIQMCLGNFAEAMVSAERSLELCRRYGDRAREGDACSVSGIILLEVGLYDDAATRFAEALEILSRTASRWSRADCLIYAGTCEIRRGQGPDGDRHVATGHAMLDEAVAEARRLGARYLEANALVGRAGALLARGELRGAIDDAAAATRVARDATLVGYEIQGLARHALAIARAALAGDQLALAGTGLADAGAMVDRALELLDHQKYLEGSEEEVLAACVEVLITSGASERAEAVKQRGRDGYERKLAMLRDPVWRSAYAAVSEHRFLLS